MKKLFSSLASVRGSALMLITAVFIAGGFAGAAYERSQDRSRLEDRRGERRGGGREGGGDRGGPGRDRRGDGLPSFFDSLNLSSSQRDSIRKILAANRPRTDAVFARAREAALPEVRAIAASTRASIDSLLTAEQREKLAKMPRDDRRRGPSGRDSGRRN